MKSFLLLVLASCCIEAQTTTTRTVFDSSIFTRLLVSERYGRSNNPQNFRHCHRNPFTGRRRCHQDDNNLLPLLYAASFKTVTETTCYPDSATFERQRSNGEFETIPVTELKLGDMVKCLNAPMGPVTMHPTVGICSYVAVSHNLPNSTAYTQIFYKENGQSQMIALSPTHLLWSSRDNSLKGVVDPDQLKISNDMFVESRWVRSGDVILVDVNDTLQYRQVTDVKIESMAGMHNPKFTNGGLPFVNNVLGTTSAFSIFGGHWPEYFKFLWFQDAKFVDPHAATIQMATSPWVGAEFTGNITVNNDCFLNEIINDMRAGVDVTAFTDYTTFAQEYVLPCSKVAAPAHFDVRANLKAVLALGSNPSKAEANKLQVQFGQIAQRSQHDGQK